MTITTIGTARHVTPTVIRTFFKHYYEQMKKNKKDRHLEATDELFFHEAFLVVKRFISLATNDTVEAIQAFTNTRVPKPSRATVVPVLISLSSCDQAAQAIINYFGPEELKNVVGGEKWWQVRGLNGVEAQWVAMTSDWKKAKIVEDMPNGDAQAKAAKYASCNRRHERKRSSDHRLRDKKPQITPDGQHSAAVASKDANNLVDAEESSVAEGDKIAIEGLDRLRRVLLYIHGGGYYFGSFTTHVYQIVRLARKMGGRAFAPVYRKAPGYPWPAPLQDCLAAYLYLTDPPPDAKHKAVNPKNIILAGDSAGGGMCLAMLCMFRDLGLPMPAGAVLISPWCDMTHSFPSILQNTDTDIIPPYGFVHKPSTLWPIPALVKQDDTPIRRIPWDIAGVVASRSDQNTLPVGQTTCDPPCKDVLLCTVGEGIADRCSQNRLPTAPLPLKSAVCNVPMADGSNFELREQIQLYATNSQLYHPLCSPVLQGSLGGLPPLYIIAGDSEVLRDEIIMLAHRAACPDRYPLPEHLLAKNAHARETAARFNSQPTKVHLQVFDYQCHVLTLFSFTTAARYAYRAIASFCKYVTNAQTTRLDDPFPSLREEASNSSSIFSDPPDDCAQRFSAESGNNTHLHGRDTRLPRNSTRAGTVGEQVLADSPTEMNAQCGKNSKPDDVDDSRSVDVTTEATPQTHRDASTLILQLFDEQSQSSTMTEGLRSNTVSPGDLSTIATSVSDRALGGFVSKFDPAALKTTRGAAKDAQDRVMTEKRCKVTLGVANDYSGQIPLKRSDYKEHMIRERVDVRGAVRPLESEEKLQAINLFVEHPEQIGVIREGLVKRYLEGQNLWNSRFKRTLKKVEKHRAANEETCAHILRVAQAKGRIRELDGRTGLRGQRDPREWVVEREKGGSEAEWVDEARFGPVDVALAGENPPPSALAGRRDCDDAVTLLRTSLHLSARDVGRHSKRSLLRKRLAGQFPILPPAEAQQRPRRRRVGMHGLDLWNQWMGRLTRRKADREEASTTTPSQEVSGQPTQDASASHL